MVLSKNQFEDIKEEFAKYARTGEIQRELSKKEWNNFYNSYLNLSEKQKRSLVAKYGLEVTTIKDYKDYYRQKLINKGILPPSSRVESKEKLANRLRVDAKEGLRSIIDNVSSIMEDTVGKGANEKGIKHMKRVSDAMVNFTFSPRGSIKKSFSKLSTVFEGNKSTKQALWEGWLKKKARKKYPRLWSAYQTTRALNPEKAIPLKKKLLEKYRNETSFDL